MSRMSVDGEGCSDAKELLGQETPGHTIYCWEFSLVEYPELEIEGHSA